MNEQHDKPSWRAFIMNRPVTDAMIIIFTIVVAFIMIVSSLALVIAAFVHPEVSVSGAADALWSTITSMVAGLLGLIAGRASRPKEDSDARAGLPSTTDSEDRTEIPGLHSPEE